MTQPPINNLFQTFSEKTVWVDSCFMFLWHFTNDLFQIFLKKSVSASFCHMRHFVYIYTSIIHTFTLLLIILFIHTRIQKSCLLCPG